jgi:hypothetical protein
MTNPSGPFLICIGGFSGTGKSTVARGLAAAIPGALHIDSDHTRKALFNVAPTEKLPPEAYTRDASQRVYAEMHRLAAEALRAGKTVIVSATFTVEEGRKQIENIAAQNGAFFKGIWLEAELAVLFDRVARRTGDASDATPDIVAYQAKAQAGAIDWVKISSGQSRDVVLQAVRDAIYPESPEKTKIRPRVPQV